MPVHVTMVKKRLSDGTECRKCQEATALLQSRGLWSRIDEIVWAHEGDPDSLGMQMGTRFGVEQAPFLIVSDGTREVVYVSVLRLAREQFEEAVSAQQQAAAIDVDDIGGI
jgi:hypothetical protein